VKISIGGNLRRLRIEKGLTQEQLAEAFNISAQAVSRWENDQAYPDLTLLSGLAMYYGTSIDEIVGMEHLRKDETMCSMVSGIYMLARQGKMEEAVEMIRENLRIYPDNSALLMALGEALARRENDEKALREAISVSERVLKSSEISMKARSTTMVNLLFLYIKAGMREKADGLIRELPHIWESREMVMPEAYDGEEYEEALKKAARKALAFLCMKIDGKAVRKAGETLEYVQLGVEFENGMSDREMLRRIGEFLEGQREG